VFNTRLTIAAAIALTVAVGPVLAQTATQPAQDSRSTPSSSNTNPPITSAAPAAPSSGAVRGGPGGQPGPEGNTTTGGQIRPGSPTQGGGTGGGR